MSLRGDEDERILAAAGSLSRRQGGAFTMDELARGAGMSRATLYRRVGGRARLLALLGERGAAPRSLRERLLAATLELIGERGPLGFSLEDVAGRAGASVTTIYRTFADRDELVRAAMQSISSHAGLRGLLDAEAPLQATLEAFVAAGLERFAAQPVLVRILFNPDETSWRYLQKLRAREAKLSRALVGYFEVQLRRRRVRGGAQGLASALVGLMLGELLAARMMDGDEARAPLSYAARARALVAMFLHGVGRRT